MKLTENQLLNDMRNIPKDIIIEKTYGIHKEWTSDYTYHVYYEVKGTSIKIYDVKMFSNSGDWIILRESDIEKLKTIFSICLYYEDK